METKVKTKSLKRKFVNEEKDTGGKKRKLTTVEKNTSRSSSDQNVAMMATMQQMLQGIQPVLMNFMSIYNQVMNQSLSNSSTHKSTGDEGGNQLRWVLCTKIS